MGALECYVVSCIFHEAGVIMCMQPVDMGNHSWTNYVQAAYKGVFEYLQSHEPEKMPQKLVGLNLMVSGQVPQGTKLQPQCVCASLNLCDSCLNQCHVWRISHEKDLMA